jgi:hypothetical protein
VASGARLDAIDQVLALDLAGRGVGAFFRQGAAVEAARALLRARRVLITTGFCVPPGVPETDGPPGAAVLGRALSSLGAHVRYVTDFAVVAPLRAALTVLGSEAEILVYPEDGDAAGLLTRERPTHLVSVERPGRSRSGDYLSARGESVAPWNRPIDELFVLTAPEPENRRPEPRGPRAGHPRPKPASRPPLQQCRRSSSRPVTIAIGDGGNEIGMGNVRGRLVRQGRLMARISSVVRVDYLVVAGTSNWGAYGIVAALQRLARRPLLHTPGLECRLLEACVAAGAVDGLLRQRRPTVDSLPLEVHTAVVELLGLAAGPSASRGALGLGALSSIMEAE